jgi:hypothetical protein
MYVCMYVGRKVFLYACVMCACVRGLCPHQIHTSIMHMLHTHAHVCGLVAGADTKSHAGELLATIV